MMIEESILTLGPVLLAVPAHRHESEERQDLLDYAQAHGLELSEARAARAVAAGRGAELRQAPGVTRRGLRPRRGGLQRPDPLPTGSGPPERT